MRKVITLLIGIFYLTTNLFSQDLGYDNNSRWFMGLNAGGTWHTSDVQNKAGFGLGLTVGRSFNYDYGKKVSFDVRGRLLYGEWRGQDRKRTNFFVPDDVLSSGATNYKDSVGYVFRNFSDEVGRLSVEVVMHLNSVRERTNFDPYIFAGIGYSWYRAKGDYLTSESSNDPEMYNYEAWDEKLTNKEYLALRDGRSETILNGSSKGSKNVGLMPSVGFGFASQLAPRVSFGFEHKTTFTGIDDFDGVVNQTSVIKNDWYHYSSLFLRFYIRPGKKHRTNSTIQTGTSNVVPNRNDDMQPPRIQYTNPSRAGTTTTVPSYMVKADINYVYSTGNVTFSHNGRAVNQFSFNSSTRKFESPVTLIEGENTFEVTGSNVYGTDRQTTTVIYAKPDPVPPIVNFQNPATSPRNVTTNTFDMEATVIYVDQKSQIRLEVNGREQTNFSYNKQTNKTRAPLNLNVGTNVVQLTGTNEVGTDSKTVVIIYNPNYATPNPTTRQPPVVYFTNPARSPHTSNATSFTLDAKVLHVMNKQNITFKQNGQVNYNFSFNVSNKDFRANVSLNAGQNVFEIIGNNQDGSSQATTILVYERASKNPPIVTIVNPNVNPYQADQENLNFIATVLNVSSKNQVEVKINGQPTSNFTFTNSTVQANIRLAGGTTTIDVKGTNSDGVDQKQTVINYRKPVTAAPLLPIVEFVNPNSNPITVKTNVYNVVANVRNVANESGVEVHVNGVKLTRIDFAPATSQLKFGASLKEGSNSIVVKGTNNAGTDSKTTTVVYVKDQKPVIVLTNPARCPASFYEGANSLRGYVTNVNSEKQLIFKVNGNVIQNASVSLKGNVLNFTVPLNVSVAAGDLTFTIEATNSGGTEALTCLIKPIKRVVKPVKIGRAHV